MSHVTHDYPVHHEVILNDAQAVIEVASETSKYGIIKIVDVLGLVGSSPSAATISVGDGVSVDRYGTIEIASGGVSGNTLDTTLNLTSDAESISGISKLVFTNSSVPANAVTDLVVIIGYH